MQSGIKKLLIIILTTASLSFSQSHSYSISGRVSSLKDGEPLISANVFISGSAWGTTTDHKGNFSLNNIPAGNHQIVASIIGYEPVQQAITLAADKEVKLVFKLKEKIYELGEVKVVSEIPDEWLDYLKLFKVNFLGQSDFAEECIIENETSIDFSKTDNVLTASVEEPLIINNKALGYKVECYLLTYRFNLISRVCTYFFNTKFTEFIPSNDDEREKWKENRETAYRGSLKHFLVSLIRNDYAKEGFRIFQIAGYYEAELKDISSIFRKDTLKENKYHLKFFNDLIIWYSPGFWKQSQNSILRMLVDSVTLDESGEPNEVLPFQLNRYWATKGIADQLPKNYPDN